MAAMGETAGGPITEADRPSQEFVQVTPGLVRKVGAVRALVWARIDWRTNASSFAAIDPDGAGERWWRANLETVSRETGLSTDQVQRAIAWLETQGHLESRQLGKARYDRTKTYRTVVGPMTADDAIARGRRIGSASSHDAESRRLPMRQGRPELQDTDAHSPSGRARWQETENQSDTIRDIEDRLVRYGVDLPDRDLEQSPSSYIDGLYREQARARQLGLIPEHDPEGEVSP